MPQTISQAMVDGTLGDLTQPPGEALPWYADMAESIPTITAVAGTKAFRGSGTMLRGGSGANIGGGGWVREGVRQANYARPRNWMQFGTQDYFHHQGPLTSKGVAGAGRAGAAGRQTVYNPFYAAAGVNWVGRALGGEGTGRVAGRLAKTGFGQSLVDKGYVGHGRELVSKGFYSRVSAAGRVGWMSDRQFGRAAGSSYNFLRGAGYTAEGAQGVLRGGKAATQAAFLTGGTGTLSGRIGGFMAGAGRPVDRNVMSQLYRTAKFGDTPAAKAGARAALRGQGVAAAWGRSIGLKAGQTYTARQMVGAGVTAGRTALKQGGRAAAARTVGKGIVMGGARVAGLTVPGLNVAMAAWLVYDLAKLSVKGAGYAAQIGVDAYKSFQGGMGTGIMEQGFKDTEATMTSRARGVQAIQNSRLNARGVLGVEAGAMHAHFG